MGSGLAMTYYGEIWVIHGSTASYGIPGFPYHERDSGSPRTLIGDGFTFLSHFPEYGAGNWGRAEKRVSP